MKARLDRLTRPWIPQGLYLRRDDRVLGGVCSGLGRWLGVDPTIVRLMTVLLALANGLGVVLYVLAWAVLPRSPTTVGPDGDPHQPEPDRASDTERLRDVDRQSLERAVALGLITLGILLVVRALVPVFPDQFVWPAAVVATGLGLVWARADDVDRARWRALASRLPGEPLASLSGRGVWVWVRVVVGATLLILGIFWFLRTNEALSSVGGGIGQIGFAILATALGISVLLGPWIVKLIRQLRDERHERIRSEERAEMAAHLHDSVLQTLALIQRQAETPRKARSLARRQERELRAWLYDARRWAGGVPASLAAALDQVSDDVEADHDVTIDVVVVGDHVLDEPSRALVAALREAVVNAAKHSGEDEVSVYVELQDAVDGAGFAGPDSDHAGQRDNADAVGGKSCVAVEAFVRDRGKGFVPRDVPRDRRGIADSIVGRLARYGGEATVRSAPGEGTEVSLHMTLGDGDA